MSETTTGKTSRDFFIDIQEGTVDGHSLKRIIGFMSNAGAAEADIWSPGTTKVLPAAAGVVSIVSDDANDTSAGTGARTGIVKGLDADFREITRPFIFNGLTPVVTSKEFLRIHEVEILTSDPTTRRIPNIGTITVTVGGDLQAQIEPLAGISNMSHFTIPEKTIAYVKQFRIRSETTDTIIKFKVAKEGGPFLNREPISISTELVDEDLSNFAFLPPKTDILATAQLTAGPSTRQVEAEYKLILVKYTDAEINSILGA